jgi:hypothetical protein
MISFPSLTALTKTSATGISFIRNLLGLGNETSNVVVERPPASGGALERWVGG